MADAVTMPRLRKLLGPDPICMVNSFWENTGHVSACDLDTLGLTYSDDGPEGFYPLTPEERATELPDRLPLVWSCGKEWSAVLPYFWIAEGTKWVGFSVLTTEQPFVALTLVKQFNAVRDKVSHWRVVAGADDSLWEVDFIRPLEPEANFREEFLRVVELLNSTLLAGKQL